MERIHGNTHVFVLSCKFLTCKHKNMRVSMYSIIMDKGLCYCRYKDNRTPVVLVSTDLSSHKCMNPSLKIVSVQPYTPSTKIYW